VRHLLAAASSREGRVPAGRKLRHAYLVASLGRVATSSQKHLFTSPLDMRQDFCCSCDAFPLVAMRPVIRTDP